MNKLERKILWRKRINLTLFLFSFFIFFCVNIISDTKLEYFTISLFFFLCSTFIFTFYDPSKHRYTYLSNNCDELPKNISPELFDALKNNCFNAYYYRTNYFLDTYGTKNFLGLGFKNVIDYHLHSNLFIRNKIYIMFDNEEDRTKYLMMV